jgi:hypothetical protein
MKAIILYDWLDKDKANPLAEVPVQSTEDLTRNGKKRIYVWTGGDEEFNFTLYPDYGTAYPEYDGRVQKQRIAERYLYTTVE